MGRGLLLLAVLTGALPGCAAVALPAVGAAVVASGAGTVVRVGTEYTLSGAAYRTFSQPLHVVRGATLQALDAADVEIAVNEPTEHGSRIVARVLDRTVDVRLESLAPSLTRLRLSVRHGLIRRDRATASEIITQTVARLPAAGRHVIEGPGTSASPVIEPSGRGKPTTGVDSTADVDARGAPD